MAATEAKLAALTCEAAPSGRASQPASQEAPPAPGVAAPAEARAAFLEGAFLLDDEDEEYLEG